MAARADVFLGRNQREDVLKHPGLVGHRIEASLEWITAQIHEQREYLGLGRLSGKEMGSNESVWT